MKTYWKILAGTRKRLSLIGALTIACAAFLGVADAVDENTPPRTAGSFMGQVVSVAVKTRLLKANNPTETLTFQVASDAKIVGKDDQPVPLKALRTGEKVTVNYSQDEALLVAHHITLTERTTQPPVIEALEK